MHLYASKSGFEDQTSSIDKIKYVEWTINLPQLVPSQHEMGLLFPQAAENALLTF